MKWTQILEQSSKEDFSYQKRDLNRWLADSLGARYQRPTSGDRH
ncbi:hypothetical protein [Aetokthonos hydrillicola]|nr:hypothetical protein [Aetokthonos hydrillicola]